MESKKKIYEAPEQEIIYLAKNPVMYASEDSDWVEDEEDW